VIKSVALVTVTGVPTLCMPGRMVDCSCTKPLRMARREGFGPLGQFKLGAKIDAVQYPLQYSPLECWVDLLTKIIPGLLQVFTLGCE